MSHVPTKMVYAVNELHAPDGVIPISRAKLFTELQSGRLKSRKIGSRRVVLADDLNAWLANLPDGREES
jgi:hypothetical protein